MNLESSIQHKSGHVGQDAEAPLKPWNVDHLSKQHWHIWHRGNIFIFVTIGINTIYGTCIYFVSKSKFQENPIHLGYFGLLAITKN